MNNHVFRLLAFLIACILLFGSLAGCRGQKKGESINSELPTPKIAYKVPDKTLSPSSTHIIPYGTPDTTDNVMITVTTCKNTQTPKPVNTSKSNEIEIETPKPTGNDMKSDVRKSLEGKVICIDAGHQRKTNYEKEPLAPGSSELKIKDPGGTSGVFTGIPEYKLNLKVSQKLKAGLEALGAKVVMTRETDDVNMGNIDRAKIANSCNADLFIRIHADGLDNHNVKGMSILIPGNRYVKDRKVLTESKEIANNILKCALKTTGAKSRGIIERNDLTGFNWAKVPMVLIEMGFMTNQDEDRLLNSDDYQDLIVKGIIQGMVEYFVSGGER